MVREKLQIWVSLEPKYINPSTKGSKQCTTVWITSALSTEALVCIYFIMYVFRPILSILVHLQLGTFVLIPINCWLLFASQNLEKAMRTFPTALSMGYFLSPPGEFLCSIDTDHYFSLKFFFFLLWPRTLCLLVLFLHCWAFLSHHLWFPPLLTS